MNVTMHIPPFKVTGATHVVHRLETGPVGEMHFQPEAGFQVFRSLADIDAVIGAYVALRAEYGEAEALYAARPLAPLPRRDAEPAWAAPVIELSPGTENVPPPSVVESAQAGPGDFRDSDVQPDPYIDAITAGHRTEYEPEPLPVLPHRQPGVVLAEAETAWPRTVPGPGGWPVPAPDVTAEAGHPDHGPAFVALEQDMARLDEA